MEQANCLTWGNETKKRKSQDPDDRSSIAPRKQPPFIRGECSGWNPIVGSKRNSPSFALTWGCQGWHCQMKSAANHSQPSEGRSAAWNQIIAEQASQSHLWRDPKHLLDEKTHVWRARIRRRLPDYARKPQLRIVCSTTKSRDSSFEGIERSLSHLQRLLLSPCLTK